jgi:chitin disaccharide deacetylase
MFAGLPIGVHLTLTCEYQGYRWRGLTNGTSLLDGDGFMPATTEAAVEQLSAVDALVECRAQIETALAWDVDVTHLDAHMFVMQSRSDLLEIYLQLAEEFRLPLRMVSREESDRQGFHARERAGTRGLLFNDHFISHWPRRTRDVFAEAVPDLPAGISEIFAHPVDDGDELRAYDPLNKDVRAHDAVCLTDPTLAELLDRHDIKRISFREIRDLQRTV